MTQSLEHIVAGAREALESAAPIVGPIATSAPAPRFELFHAPNSICSQKVRCVLAHHGLAYISHGVNLFLGQTYLPGYVRLRMRGCAELGGALVSHHSGSTSTSAGGCDGAVVPTLVDWQSGEVLVDSKRICLHLDALMPDADRLRPDALADAIDREIEIVDNLPNYQMLMGRTVSASESSASGEAVASKFSERKVAWCDQYLRDYADDEQLVQAYNAKRAKELSAATDLFSPEAMRDAYARAEEALHGLEGKLKDRAGAWLLGDRFTLADLFWGIELLRMKNMGVAIYWEAGRLPHVERFSAATEALPDIRTAILEWPGAMY